MSHYDSLISLKNTTKRIMYFTRLSLLPSFPLIDFLSENVITSLQDSLFPREPRSISYYDNLGDEITKEEKMLRIEKFFRKKEVALDKREKREFYCGRDWNGLDEELREAICKMEDVLESHMLPHLLSRSQNPLLGSDDDDTNIDFTKVEQEIIIFLARVVTWIKKAFSRGKWTCDDEQVASSAYSSSPWFSPLPQSCNSTCERIASSSSAAPYSWRTCFSAEDRSDFVGMQDTRDALKHQLSLSKGRGRLLTEIVGMAGIGKTALAKVVIEDPEVWDRFDCHAYVPVGPKYRLKQGLLCILSQLNHENDYHDNDDGDNKNNNKKKRKRMDDDENTLGEYVRMFLEDKRYIILFDDVWDKHIMKDFSWYLPDDLNGSRVILTSRVSIDSFYFKYSLSCFRMRFLDKEESWDLLRKNVFGTDSCPYELKKLGKRIAEKCEGLPLAILSVGNHLSNVEKTVGYWQCIADKGITSIITADDEVFKILHPSYQYLPLRFKPLFLYLGVFPQCRVLSASELTKLLTAEGVLEDGTLNYLVRLKDDHLVIVKQDRATQFRLVRTKSCSLHIVYWCYCKIQARKENLFQILNTIEDLEGAKSKRRLCIHNNCLFGIKESRDSIASVSNMRSLLCTGPYHKFPVSISLGLKLLRVFDAVAIRFYEFPFEALKLVLLRYLAFTFDGNLPPSISQLISLEFLIVRRHTRIIDHKRPSYLPFQIWSMKELKHLQVVGSDLPEPPHRDAQLPNLLKLLDVTPRSCTKNVLEKIPNLMKLGVQIVLPYDATEPPCSLDYLRELDQLESLKCHVVNPRPSSSVAANAYPSSIFPKGLRKLSLSGFGYSWDQMSNIARLAKLKRLKLRHCAFRGSSWEVKEDEFHRLELLVLEDIDLRYWSKVLFGFYNLRHLIIEHCYNLECITMDLIYRLLAIEIVDCKQSVVDWAERCLNISWCTPTLKVVSSWKDGKDLR